MISPKLTFLFFAVIILEGYVVLSSELIAIRQTVPFIGSGTDTVSIIIAAVLMPLAFGYQAGGRFKPGFHKGRYWSVRDKLIFNLIMSSFILMIGLSYAIMTIFFYMLTQYGINHRLIMVTIYSALFLVYPVYLLGQTIPLISNYFSKRRLAQVTGKILFFSTMGSFLGAVFSTLVLMSTIGVHHTASLNFLILFLLVFLLSKKKFSEVVLGSFAIMCTALYLNSDAMMKHFSIIENNKYNTISFIVDEDGAHHLSLNNNASSMYNPETGEKHKYVEFIERQFLEPVPEDAPPLDILVIGAGAFTFGYRDEKNRYDYIDIDGSLKELSETYILQDELPDNVEFHAVPARGFLTSTDKAYDFIFIDAYFGDTSIPEHLATREFFQQVKDHLKEGGAMAANFIIAPNFANKFSMKMDNTIRSVFPYISRHVTDEDYMIWNANPNVIRNVIYMYKDNPSVEIGTDEIYTDNLNTLFYDKPQQKRAVLQDDGEGEDGELKQEKQER